MGKLSEILEGYIKERLANRNNSIADRVFITHSECEPGIIDSTKKFVKRESMYDEIFITRARCIVSVNCGPGRINVLFVRENDVVFFILMRIKYIGISL